MEDSAEKPLKELFAEAIAKRKAREEAQRKELEGAIQRWVPAALGTTLANARNAARHGAGASRVWGGPTILGAPPEIYQQLWAQLLDQLAEIGSQEGFEVVPQGEEHWLVWDREEWDRRPKL